MGTDSSQLRNGIDDARMRLEESVEAFGFDDDYPNRVKEVVIERVTAVKEAVSDAASAISDAMPDPEDIRAGADRIGRMVVDNPIGMALGSVAVGFLIGLLLPRTSLESERIAPLAQDMRRMAKDAGAQAVSRGRQIVWDAAQAAVKATLKK